MRFCQPVTPITEFPHLQSTQVSEGLYGESAEITEQQGEFCQIRMARDDYRGYVPKTALLEPAPIQTTHIVVQRFTPLFSRNDIKSAVALTLPFGSELHLQECDDDFYLTDQGQYVFKQHCCPVGTVLTEDVVSIALDLFLGSPYRWGGRSPAGVDCSGLVQVCTYAAGYRLPRDSGPQEQFFVRQIRAAERQRNDLVFWPGHVGLLLDPDNLVHATAHSLSTVIEPLTDVVDRAGAVSSIRRLPEHTD